MRKDIFPFLDKAKTDKYAVFVRQSYHADLWKEEEEEEILFLFCQTSHMQLIAFHEAQFDFKCEKIMVKCVNKRKVKRFCLTCKIFSVGPRPLPESFRNFRGLVILA